MLFKHVGGGGRLILYIYFVEHTFFNFLIKLSQHLSNEETVSIENWTSLFSLKKVERLQNTKQLAKFQLVSNHLIKRPSACRLFGLYKAFRMLPWSHVPNNLNSYYSNVKPLKNLKIKLKFFYKFSRHLYSSKITNLKQTA